MSRRRICTSSCTPVTLSVFLEEIIEHRRVAVVLAAGFLHQHKSQDVSMISLQKSVSSKQWNAPISQNSYFKDFEARKRGSIPHFYCFCRQQTASANKSCLHCECDVEQSRFRPRPPDELKTDGQPGLILPNLAYCFANHVNLLSLKHCTKVKHIQVKHIVFC
jgi:hypothetical protein